MPILPQIVFAGLNFTHSATVPAAFSKFVHDRSLPLILWTWISAHAAAALNTVSNHAAAVLHWLAEPHVLAVLFAWSITFVVVFLLLSLIGFNPIGIGAGTLAAAFQSFVYGGFTPAGGLFATLTSLGMLGVLAPLQATVAAVLSTTVAVFVWLCGVGR